MDNSVETILGDIKKLTKELERAYGKVKPQICDVTGADSCPNTKCWVQNIRDQYDDRINSLEDSILNTINRLVEVNHNVKSPELLTIIQSLDILINPTPCVDCAKNPACRISYKFQGIHRDACIDFVKSFGVNDKETNVAVQF